VHLQPRRAFWVLLVAIAVLGLAVGRIFGPGWGIAIIVVGGLAMTALTIEGDERFFRRTPNPPEE
jgi:hypothetical protein